VRIAARAFGGALLMGVLVSALFMAGRSYLWCVPMQQVMQVSCCCAGESAEPRVRAACCETREILGLPQVEARGAGAPAIPPALAATAVLAPPQAVPPLRSVRAAPPLRGVRERPIRAGPTLPSRSVAVLQVFRC
jgi:hypothetical protein